MSIVQATDRTESSVRFEKHTDGGLSQCEAHGNGSTRQSEGDDEKIMLVFYAGLLHLTERYRWI